MISKQYRFIQLHIPLNIQIERIRVLYPNNYEDHITADGIFNLAAGDVIRWKMSGYGGSISFAKMKFQGYLLG